MRAALALLGLLAAAGCRSSSPPVDPGACAAVAGADATRVVAHLGPAWEMLVRLRFADGVPDGTRDLGACVKVAGSDGKELTVARARRPLDAAYTLLLVDPGETAEENERVRAIVRQVVQRRPAHESISIWRWGATAGRVAAFSAHRPYLDERTLAGLTASAAPPAPASDALVAVSSPLGTVGGDAKAALRTLVVVSSRRPAPLPALAVETARPHLVLWLGPANAAGIDLPAGQRFTYESAEAATDAVAALSARMDAYLAHGHYGFGRCAGEAGADLVELRAPAAPPVLVPIPATLAENRGGTCAPEQAAKGVRPYPRRLELVFTDEQRRNAETIWSRGIDDPATTEDPREEFALSVRLSPEHQPAPAKAHFRGKGSFRCERRNYTVDLDARAPRFVIPGSATRKFFLISMCNDRLYLRNHTTLALLADENLFVTPFGYVDLFIDGVSQGAYLFIENMTDSLRRMFPGTSSVVRRYLGVLMTGGEVKYAAGDPMQALAAYDAVVTDNASLTGPALEAGLRARLDLDRYLTWLAMMTLLGSGDYVDEVFFHSIPVVDGDGPPREHFAAVGWDQDDIFSVCHIGGVNAYVDPHGLAYCAEAEVDKLILGDPHLYRRYADTLAALMDRLPPARFEAALRRSADSLLGRLEDPEVLRAMRELWAIQPNPPMSFTTARNLITAEIETLAATFDRNQKELRARLDRYRETLGPASVTP